MGCRHAGHHVEAIVRVRSLRWCKWPVHGSSAIGGAVVRAMCPAAGECRAQHSTEGRRYGATRRRPALSTGGPHQGPHAPSICGGDGSLSAQQRYQLPVHSKLASLHVHTMHQKLAAGFRELLHRGSVHYQLAEFLPSVSHHVVPAITALCTHTLSLSLQCSKAFWSQLERLLCQW